MENSSEDKFGDSGQGLSLEAVRTLLISKHGTSISPDDPLLMVVTIQNAFLHEYEKLLGRHHEALTTFLGEAGAQHLDTAKQAVEAISTGFKASSLGVIRDTLAAHAQAMGKLQNNLVWLAAIAAISAAVNVAVFVWRGM